MKKTILLLSLIVVFGFLTRSYFWFYGFSGYEGLGGLYGQEFYLSSASDIVTSFDLSTDKSHIFIERNRSEIVSRFLYPLYLTPIYIFWLNASVYFFWLHHFFVAFTIIFIFLSASKIGGQVLDYWAHSFMRVNCKLLTGLTGRILLNRFTFSIFTAMITTEALP